MLHRTVQSGSQTYLIASDGLPSPVGRSQGLAYGLVVDEITGSSGSAGLRVLTDGAGLTGKTASGVAGLMGVAAPPVVVSIAVEAPGYLPYRQSVDFSVAPPLPVVLNDFALHRLPVVVRGRVARLQGGRTVPVAGATVAVTAYWPSLPLAPASTPPRLFSLRSPFYFARPAMTGRVRNWQGLFIPGEDKLLLEPAPAGAATLLLSDRVNLEPLALAPNDLLQIDTLDPDRSEYITVQAVAGASDADQPARVTLTCPLASGHLEGTTVRRLRRQATGGWNALERAAIPGDTCLFPATTTGLANAETVEIDAPGLPNEYHAIQRFTVTSDADGYYRLPPVHRVAQITVTAIAGLDTLSQTVAPDYENYENRLDLVFA
jgi:hypothetical protein